MTTKVLPKFGKLLFSFSLFIASTALAQNHIVLVDPFGFQAGEDFPAKAIELGYTPILVFSDEETYEKALELFPAHIKKILHKGNLQATAQEITRSVGSGSIVASLPGKESGTIIAESLAQQLELPTNDLSKPLARQHKVALQEALKAAGLNYLASVEIKQGQDIDSAIQSFLASKEFSPQQQFISKPCESSCSDTVFITPAKDIASVAKVILGKKNTLAKKVNPSVAIQVLAEGVEYIVDVISFNFGTHIESVPVGVWRYYREDSTAQSRSGLIKHVDWIPLSEAPADILDYATKASQAAGVKQGISHVEVFKGPHGVVTHDLAARLPGGLPRITQDVTDGRIDILKLAIESVVNPLKTYQELKVKIAELNKIKPADQKFARIVFLNRRGQRNTLSPHVHDSVKSINAPTLVGYRTFVEPGAWQPMSVDVLSGVLRLHLVGKRSSVLNDEAKFRRAHTQEKRFLSKGCRLHLSK